MMDLKKYLIGRVPIAITDYKHVMALISAVIRERGKGYVCVSNMRTVTFANENDEYYEVMRGSLLNVPDGTPLVWCGHWWGIKEVKRVCGPILFEKMMADKEHGFRHFFLGDTDETLAAMTKKATEDDGAVVAGSCSPPFKPLEEYDFEGIGKMINDSGANVVWTSLRAPKQDFLAHKLVPLLHDGIVIVGVGAAFRTYLGEYKTPEGLLQQMGLGGLGMIRNSTLPKEFRWYAKHIFVLAGYFLKIKWKRLRHKKCDEL
ncbi:MAG: WecB/TagA/CpsF family glycosyltransferase [Prevotella sp.]|nr:WecB/TagA/CpsF family glycosyltransferase [Prevotella sp.]